MKAKLKKTLWQLIALKNGLNKWYRENILIYNRNKYGYCGHNSVIEGPLMLTDQSKVFFHDSCKVRRGLTVINSSGKFVVKKYSAIAFNCMVVCGNHRPTATVPHIILGSGHINDKELDVIIEEDAWIGVNSTLICGAHIGRGAIVGACSMVNKEVPPYAVVVGSPAKIIASVFSIDQIIEHEKELYSEHERFSREYLTDLFDTYFSDKKSIGTSALSEEDLKIIHLKKKQFNISY